jgi:hypothetical protein
MSLAVDDSPLQDEFMLQGYMEEIRYKVIEKLSPLEIAALFQDFKEFQIRLREEKDLAYGEYNYEE